jgi:hypothetical protein
MPKSHDRPHREAKKPKANKKPAQAATSFLRPQSTPPAPAKPKEPQK